MVGNKSWRGWRPLWRWGWARRRRWRGRRWRRRRLRWGAWATEPAPTAFAVGAVLYGELAYAPRLAHSMMRIPLRRRGAEGWRRGRRRIGRRPWRPAHRASASRAALAFAKLPCVSGKMRESRAARQSAQRRARNATQSTKEARSSQCTAVAMAHRAMLRVLPVGFTPAAALLDGAVLRICRLAAYWGRLGRS